MRTLADMLLPVKEALLTVSENTGHYYPIDGTTTHIVWQEDSENSGQSGDNRKLAQAISGSIDLYAKREDLNVADKVQNALNQRGVSFSLNSVTNENEEKSGFVHFEWLFEVS